MKIRILMLLGSPIALLFAFHSRKPLVSWPKQVYSFQHEAGFKERVELGHLLFYDPVLSADSSVSCASCHLQYTAFAHVDHALSHGIHDSIGNRNAPALMNLAWHRELMWDGAIHHLDMQSLAPISHPAEMGSSIQEVVGKLNRSRKYAGAFYKAFGDSLASGEFVLKSISRFLTTLVSNRSKYDSVMNGTSVFTAQQKSGYEIFRKHCNSCHTEPLFTSLKFEDNGLPLNPRLNDLGRHSITQNTADSFRFKIPTLRNITYSYPYMHDGRFNNLGEVLNHYEKGMVHRKGMQKSLKHNIRLNSVQKVDLVAFLLTLNDKHFLFNPELGFPKNK
jgi:cytochrome c peroxidase